MRLVLAGKHVVHFAIESVQVTTDEDVGSLGNGNRAFGVLANGDSWNSEKSGFFLYSTGIGDDGGGAVLQGEKFDVGAWLQED